VEINLNNNHPGQEFEALLDYLKRSRGFDFSGYKRSSLVRRIDRRMQVTSIEGYTNYIDYLEVHPDEFNLLFNTILINVTSFFRDEQCWEEINREIIPRIREAHNPEDQIRVWTAGCASGEETYTIAMLLAEHLGSANFTKRVKIYATDIDEEALNKARQGIYSEKEVDGIPPELLEKYFDRSAGNYVFNKELRRSVIFGRHDLIQDAPISRIDLLICRNLLMYFNANTQSRVLARLHFGLSDGGYLFLGRAEMLLTHTNIFAPVNLKLRIFSGVHKLNPRDRLLVTGLTGNDDTVNHLANQIRLRDAAFDATPIAQVVIDSSGALILANDRARTQFGLTIRDIGRPFQDLQLSYRPVDLRSTIDQVNIENSQVILRRVASYSLSGELYYLDINVTPVLDKEKVSSAMVITFQDVTNQVYLQQQLEHTNQELETAMEELQSTNEELETTNEELQSANEELETMNEEMQSTNEELETLNDELHQRTENLNRINTFLETILTSLRGGVAVLDTDLRVLIWNRKSEDLWGIRADEVMGRNFLNLDIGLPVLDLTMNIRRILSGESDLQESRIRATNRRGKSIDCRVIVTPLIGQKQKIEGTILMIEDGQQAEKA
jgi:two-component system, chemotaxis family, CheB/CheR fusion protein